MPFEIKKYPRTPHLEGSRLQPGDEDLSQIPYSDIEGRHLVVEEKIDGANSAISFDDNGEMLLQSRGHYLTGGYRERHYNLMKQWASVHENKFRSVLGSRYIMYGEWMYAKHSIFYDMLPHYFMEFDIFDREKGIYLDTDSRRMITENLPIKSVPVLKTGEFSSKDDLLKLLGKSNYISSDHIENLKAEALRQGLDPDEICRSTDQSDLMEGLYIKVEEGGQVASRLKYVRRSFLQNLAVPDTQWINRPIVPNLLSCPLESLFE
ncbi:MAG: RNA ligase family protein [Oscillospiraceae bacterium]|nr:RNA ligase family protein [Oscillospiraceae bacterium]